MFGRSKKDYTEKQNAFLDALRDPDNKGDIKICRDAAGYPKTMPVGLLIKQLQDEIIEIARMHLATNGAKAALTLVDGMDITNATPLTSIITQNAERILDRIGIVKGEKLQIEEASNRWAFIPARRKDETV